MKSCPEVALFAGLDHLGQHHRSLGILIVEGRRQGDVFGRNRSAVNHRALNRRQPTGLLGLGRRRSDSGGEAKGQQWQGHQTSCPVRPRHGPPGPALSKAKGQQCKGDTWNQGPLVAIVGNALAGAPKAAAIELADAFLVDLL